MQEFVIIIDCILTIIVEILVYFITALKSVICNVLFILSYVMWVITPLLFCLVILLIAALMRIARHDQKKLKQRIVPLQNRVNKQETTKECSICLDKFADTVLIPCFHVCICSDCAIRMISRGYTTCASTVYNSPCPICRESVINISPLYFT
jgi:hypothetical protein